jgi:hypothetical protein
MTFPSLLVFGLQMPSAPSSTGLPFLRKRPDPSRFTWIVSGAYFDFSLPCDYGAELGDFAVPEKRHELVKIRRHEIFPQVEEYAFAPPFLALACAHISRECVSRCSRASFHHSDLGYRHRSDALREHASCEHPPLVSNE